MRGEQRLSEGLFSYLRLEDRIAKDHPLRPIRSLVNEVLAGLSDRFEELYSHTGRPSIPPEYLLRATLVQAFFTVRSERQLMEQIDYNLLFRWVCRAVARRCGVGRYGVHEEPRSAAGG